MTTLPHSYLLELKQQLQQLTFDEKHDQLASEWPLCHEYLRFYNFPNHTKTQHFFGKIQALDYQLATHYWLPKNPTATICIMHGYFDHTGLYGHLINYLLENNYAVVTFDLPGHGLSSGEQVTIESFNHYEQIFSCLLDNIKHLPPPFHAVGQSTGGAILLNYLLTKQAQSESVLLDKVILLAPLIQPAHWNKGRLMYALLHHFKNKIRRKFLLNSSNNQFINFVQQQDPLQAKHLSLEWVGAMKQWIHDFTMAPKSPHSIKVIQGEKDNTVNWQFNCRAIKNKFPNYEEMRIPEANHHLVNEDSHIRAQVFLNMGL